MKTNPIPAVQAAFVACLAEAIPDIPTLDFVPDNTKFPYFTVGEFTAQEDRTKGYEVWGVTQTYHAWSRYKGNLEASTMLLRADQALDALTIDGYAIIDRVTEYSTILEDPDGETRHGIQRDRYTLQKEA
jgi:hypothetical protein